MHMTNNRNNSHDYGRSNDFGRNRVSLHSKNSRVESQSERSKTVPLEQVQEEQAARSEGDHGYWHALFGFLSGNQYDADTSESESEEEVHELNDEGEIVSERQ